MFQVTHFGLYFTPAAQAGLKTAGNHANLAPAWEALDAKQADSQAADIDRALAAALLVKLRGDDQAQTAGHALAAFQNAVSVPLPENDLEAAAELQTRLHVFELLRDHPAFLAARGRYADDLSEQVARLTAASDPHEYAVQLWLSAVKLLSGIVFEREAWFDEGVSAFKQVIAKELRPQGFIQPAVEPDRQSQFTALERQVLATKALILMAEAASASVGLDLWSYEARGVSVATAAMYPIYYFYTTQKWQWDEDLSPETVQNIFRRHGGWLEMAQRRLQHKDIALLLNDLRPLWDRSGGGMTTLTHGVPVKLKRRSLFG